MQNQETLNTNLINACTDGEFEQAKKLIEQGADINCRSDYRWTPLHYATHSGNLELVKYLIEEKGAYFSDAYDDKQGFESVLLIAAYDNKLELLKYLIKKGALIDVFSLSKYPDEIIPAIHAQMQSEDKWSSVLLFLVKEQPNYTEEHFEEYVLELLSKKRAEMPKNISIILHTLI